MIRKIYRRTIKSPVFWFLVHAALCLAFYYYWLQIQELDWENFVHV